MTQPNSQDTFLWRTSLLRIYVNGLIVLAIGIVIWKVIFLYSPWYDVINDPVLASILTAASILLLPLILGGIVVFGLNPLLGKWRSWSELVSLQDRLMGELSNASSPQIVLFNWPSESVKSVGVITARYAATDSHPEMAGVYCASSPRGNSGFIRFVRVDDLYFTAWTLKDFQVFNWTLGSIHPDQLLQDPPD